MVAHRLEHSSVYTLPTKERMKRMASKTGDKCRVASEPQLHAMMQRACSIFSQKGTSKVEIH